MSEYFPESKSSGGRVKVDLDLSNYGTKADFENARGVDTSKFAKNVDLACLKSEVHKLEIDELQNVKTSLNSLKSKEDKLDIGKLEFISFDLSKLSNVAKTMPLKRLI